MPRRRIDDYAMIGDCRGAALVDGRGAVDWLAWPRFDANPAFTSLLDDARGGVFRISPAGPFRARLRYLEETNVAATRFDAAGGALELLDLMPVDADGAHEQTLAAEHELLRVATCLTGEVSLRVTVDPRVGFVRAPRLTIDRRGVVRWEDGGALYTLQPLRAGATPPPAWSPRSGGGSGVDATLVLRAGERVAFSLAYAREGPLVMTALRDVAPKIDRTIALWRRWAARARYDGPYRAAVVRSALALKLLCYSPSGAIVAAPTTSLPERRGGDLNWDYRFCWLRDAAFTARALFGLGYEEEAAAFVDWLLHATRLTFPELHVLYDVFGERPGPERVVDVAGFGGARPVRVGNAAAAQLQIDLYGEVIDAVAQARRRGRVPDSATATFVRGLGDHVVALWRAPDQGIWEPRERPRHHVHSRLLAWVALDRLLELDGAGTVPLDAARRDRFGAARAAIAREITTRGWSEGEHSYVAELDGRTVDASLLLLSWYGFERPSSRRMRATASAIDRALGIGAGLIRRNLDLADDGGFVACAFWAVEHLARGGGSLEEATARFGRLVRLASPVGLFGELVDPENGEHLGNYPQGFSHLALVNAGLSLASRARSRAP